MNHRFIFWTALALAGIGYYAHVNPSFVDTVKALFGKDDPGIGQLVNSSKNSVKQSKLYSAVTKDAREEAIALNGKPQPGAPPPAQAQPKTPPAPPRPNPLVPTPRPMPVDAEFRSMGQKIAHGHAFARYGFDFGFKSEAEMADHIDRVLGHPDAVKFRGSRSFYWDEATRSVVILDDYLLDGGTAFKPFDGRAFFDKQ